MDRFKVEHFEREHAGEPFPKIESLAERDCDVIRAQLCQGFGLLADTSGAQLSSRLAALLVPTQVVNAGDECFDLTALLQSSGIKSQDEVFINWYHFCDIDKISLADIANHFSDIWYPSSDDIDIFDSSFSWVMTIDHSGGVALTRVAPVE